MFKNLLKKSAQKATNVIEPDIFSVWAERRAQNLAAQYESFLNSYVPSIESFPITPKWFSNQEARARFIDSAYARFHEADHIAFTESGKQISIFDLSINEQRELETSARQLVLFAPSTAIAPYFIK